MNLKSVNNYKTQVSVKENLQFYDSEKNADSKTESKLDEFFPDNRFTVINTHVFDLQDSIISGKRTFLERFDEERTNFVAIELLLLNPYFNKRDLFLSGLAIWYKDDEEVGRNNFNLEVNKNWEIVEVVQSWGTPVPGFWKSGECKAEIYLENNLACVHNFCVGNSQVVDFQNLANEKLAATKKQVNLFIKMILYLLFKKN
jgi:hypothetical protein